VDHLIQGYADDPTAKQLLTELSISNQSVKGYTLTDGIIRYKGRVWLGHNTLAQQHIMQALHNSGLGGHSGFHGTYHRIKSLFAWPAMKRAIRTYIQACSTCQQAKSERVKLPGQLEPLHLPTKPWSIVCMDFIEGLPLSTKQNVILVVIDKFTKYAHFMAFSHPFTALQVAQLYLNTVYKLHGLPEAIISDRDRIFTSSVWQELFRLSNT